MNTNLGNDRTYTPAEICHNFGLPRTTLFRWEGAKEILPAERDGKGQRVYRQVHLRSIGLLVRKKIKEEIDYICSYQTDDKRFSEDSLDIFERLYRIEVFDQHDPAHGLEALQALSTRRPLGSQTIEVLIEFARNLPIGDTLREKIWRLLADQDRATRSRSVSKKLTVR